MGDHVAVVKKDAVNNEVVSELPSASFSPHVGKLDLCTQLLVVYICNVGGPGLYFW